VKCNAQRAVLRLAIRRVLKERLEINPDLVIGSHRLEPDCEGIFAQEEAGYNRESS